jgi:hypothetical protein
MRIPSPSARIAGAVVAVAATLAVAAPAGAGTIQLSGTQTAVDESAGTSRMHGSLVGDWAITSFNVLTPAPIFHAQGTEHFSGCLDRNRDGSCSHDPSGTLELTIDYQAMYDPPGSQNLVWGACLHPVTGGTGAFASARGVITMVDTPTSNGVVTEYIGNLTVPWKLGEKSHRPRVSRARAASLACGG